MGEKELPEGWIRVSFTDVFDINGGTQPPKSVFIDLPKEGYIRLLQIRDFGSKPVPTYIPNNGKLMTCEVDDILIARYGASIGRIVTGMEGAYNVALAKVKIPIQIDKVFVKWLLKSTIFQNPILSIQRTAQNGFNKEDLSNIKIPLPPLAEQNRIVEKLDEIFASIEIVKTKLDAIPQLLKNFRQAVLSHAVTGKLTEKWRAEKGLEEWREEVVENLSKRVTVGFVGKMSDKYVNEGIPFLRSQNVREFRYSDKNLLYVSKEFNDEIEKSKLYPNDIVIVRSGYPGTTCVIPSFLKEANCSDILIITPKVEKLNSYFFSIFMNSEIGKKIVFQGKVGNAQQHFNTKILKKVTLNLPSLVEQEKIAFHVESLFATVDAIELKYKKLKERIDSIPQAILAKAFRGELVPLNPNDEPASELLERIKETQTLGKKITRLTQVVA